MNTKRLLILSLISILFLAGCGSDNPSPVKNNSVEIDGKSFIVIAPSLLGVSIDGQGHAAITFTNISSSTITKVLTIDFEYSPDSPISGTYSFPQQGTDRLLDDWLTNYVIIDSSNGGSEVSTNLESGNVTVKDNGSNNYTVTLNLTMLDGTVFSGKYRGKFTVMFNNQ